MHSKHPNFSKFYNKILGAIFYREFYRYIIKAKLSELFIFYIMLATFAAAIPMARTYKIFSGEDNQMITLANEVLQDFPNLEVSKSNLANIEPVKQELFYPSIQYPIIAINSEALKLSAQPSSAAITFLKDAIVIDELRLIDIFLKQAKLMQIDERNLDNSTNQYSLPYANSDYIIDSDYMLNVVTSYTDFKPRSYLYLITIFVIFTLFSILLRAMFFGAFIFFYCNKRKVALKFNKSFKLALAALIPSTCLSSINIMTLWNSNLLNSPNISSLLLMMVNIYFSIFAINSLIKPKLSVRK